MANIPTDNYPITSLLFCIILSAFISCTQANLLKVYPLADEYFEKIYLVQQNSKESYLTISCK